LAALGKLFKTFGFTKTAIGKRFIRFNPLTVAGFELLVGT
jgi:hypothetical protein